MKILAIICVIVGSLLLGYSGYCVYFSGSEIGRFSLFPADKSKVHNVQLSPSMNPLRALVSVKNYVGWRAHEMRNRSDKEVEVNVAMSGSEGTPIWEELAVISRDDDEESRPGEKTSTQSLLAFHVPADGVYAFSATTKVHQGTLRNAELVLKKNVTEVQTVLVVIGVISLICGVFILLAKGSLKQKLQS